MVSEGRMKLDLARLIGQKKTGMTSEGRLKPNSAWLLGRKNLGWGGILGKERCNQSHVGEPILKFPVFMLPGMA